MWLSAETKLSTYEITAPKESINKNNLFSVHSCTLEEGSEFFPVQIHRINVVILEPKPKKMLKLYSEINPVRNKINQYA